MTLRQTIAAQKQIVRDDWRIITTYRSSRRLYVQTSSVIRPVEWAVVNHAYKQMQWTQRSLRRNLRRLGASSIKRGILDTCTATILSREGGMNPYATNPRSGAYGGPQALPGSKMASAGADWATNIWTQIRWMVGYETERYGSPCGALAAWDHQGWY